jgi:hypothetical protein
VVHLAEGRVEVGRHELDEGHVEARVRALEVSVGSGRTPGVVAGVEDRLDRMRQPCARHGGWAP